MCVRVCVYVRVCVCVCVLCNAVCVFQLVVATPPSPQDHTPQVTQLYTEAAEVDSRIDRFKSDLVKKTTSLKAVWDKFSKRVDDRHAMLLLATHFYDNIEEVGHCDLKLRTKWLACFEVPVCTCLHNIRSYGIKLLSVCELQLSSSRTYVRIDTYLF